ncbi:MAG: UDP-N-acetylmuramoyl-tripeptide--D-alanyl-D-alanine ligase [Opitutaceae bacterium]
MPAFTADQLARWTGGRWHGEPRAPLTGFHFDSRLLTPGEVFVALRTPARDGHAFIGAAAAAGAGAALVRKADPAFVLPQLVVADPLAAWHAIAWQHRRAFPGPVIGISGSAGKTSTKDLLALLLGGAASGVAATEGNLNNHLGVPLTLTRLDPARHRYAVVEAGINTPGDMEPLAAMIEPDVAIITLIGPAHIEALGSLEGVAREKSRLPAATRPEGFALFTRETAAYAPFAELGARKLVLERADVVRPAEPPADRAYYALTQRGQETALAIAVGPPPPLAFTMPRVSDGMAQNAALAICAAWRLGVPRAVLQERLSTWRPGALRGEVRRSGERLLYVDCYNANPSSMADALGAFQGVVPAAEPRLYVLGGMEELGAEAPRHHRALGRSLKLRPMDRALVTGPFSGEVITGLREAGAAAGQAQEISEAGAAGPVIAAWRGAVFVKGSRRYRLESALAAAGEEVAVHA